MGGSNRIVRKCGQTRATDLHKMLCQKVAELRMLLRPKNRYIRLGLDFMRASTTVLLRPAGLMAGARATKTSILSLSFGWMLKVAKACAEPCENPTYDSDDWPVVSRM